MKSALLILVLFGVISFVFTEAQSVSAHANQVRSQPEAGETSEDSPSRIVIWFSEPIEEKFSEIRVLDSTGRNLEHGQAMLDPTEPQALILPLSSPLDDGAYVVAWSNVSTVDGHRVFGSFSFAVGDAEALGSVSASEQPLIQARTDPWLRWLFYMGAVTIAGVLFFEIFVILPEVNRCGAMGKSGLFLFRRVTPLLFLVGFIVSIGAHAGILIQQAFITSGGEEIGGTILGILSNTAWGRFWIGRAISLSLGLILVTLALRIIRNDKDVFLTENIPGRLSIAAALSVLLFTSLTSHNAAAPADLRSIAIITDFIHLTSISLWAGGLIAIVAGTAYTIRLEGRQAGGEVMATMVSRFTPLAMISAGAVIASGIVSGWLQVTIPAAAATPYGWTLIAKIALLSILISIAVFNRFVLSPRLPSTGFTIYRLATVEVVVSVMILLAAGWLASLEPARQYAGRLGIGISDDVSTQVRDQGATVNIRLVPGRTGENSLHVDIKDRTGDALDSVQDVRVRIRSLEQDLGEPLFSLERQDSGEWMREGYSIPIAGLHQIDIVVVRSDALDTRASFRFEAIAGGVIGDPISPDADTGWVLLGLEILIIGVLIIFAMNIRRNIRLSASSSFMGAALIIVGLLAIANPFTTRLGLETRLVNPTPANAESVSSGGNVYLANCSTCHGERGLGDGVAGIALPIQPADLTVHVPLHTDVSLYEIVSDGIIASGMPAFREVLSDEEVWDLINFLRALSDGTVETVDTS